MQRRACSHQGQKLARKVCFLAFLLHLVEAEKYKSKIDDSVTLHGTDLLFLPDDAAAARITARMA